MSTSVKLVKSVAKLGRVLGQAKRRKREYVVLSIKDASEIHSRMSADIKRLYAETYAKL